MNQGRKITVAPSYPAPDWETLQSALGDLVGVASAFQIDMVDGVFAPSVSWPFSDLSSTFQSAIAQLKPYIDQFEFEFDCMVSEPLQYLDVLQQSGAKRIIVHYGSTDNYQACLEHAHTNEYMLGLALLPTTNLEVSAELVSQFSFVQVMGIAKVGKQGQPFATEALGLIRQLRAKFPGLEIAVDGGVNAHTIPDLVAAGATRLAPGSAVIAQNNRAEAYQGLVDLVNSQQVVL